ncbi:MAG: histidinol-phosphatase, partial [Pseudomonadota bacterium]
MTANPVKVLFVDRDGTLIEEPPDEQVDSLEKVRFMPGVFAALAQLTRSGYRLVMVTNQDGLGTASFPQESFDLPQNFVLASFASQGIHFDAVCICPHRPADNCDCRKPKPGLVAEYLHTTTIDMARSAVIGDRLTDLAFATNLGIRGLRVLKAGSPAETWPAIASELLARRAVVERRTKETEIRISIDLDAEGPIRISTGI